MQGTASPAAQASGFEELLEVDEHAEGINAAVAKDKTSAPCALITKRCYATSEQAATRAAGRRGKTMIVPVTSFCEPPSLPLVFEDVRNRWSRSPAPEPAAQPRNVVFDPRASLRGQGDAPALQHVDDR
jgi:hypothetical protein